MQRKIITVVSQTPLSEAARLMCYRRLSVLPVLDRGELVGILRLNDLLHALDRVIDQEDQEQAPRCASIV